MDPKSAHFSIYLTGTAGVCMQGRQNAGENYKHWGCLNPGATSAWLKIEKRMHMYTSFVGEDVDGSIVWTVAKSIELTGIGESYNVGLAVSSARWYSQEVVFTDYEVDAYYFPSAAPSLSGMPTKFVQSEDIGSVNIAGSASEASDGSWAVKASGSDIWGHSDSFHFARFQKSGDVTAELLVEGFDDYIYSWQKGGIMFRESLAANSRHYSLFVTGSQGITNQRRTNTGGSSSHNTNYGLKATPVWLQVSKVGNQFSTAYKNVGDTEWTSLYGPMTMDFGLDEDFYVGIAVTSHVSNSLLTLRASELNFEVPARRLRKSM